MNKVALKDELVDLRMHLANAENQALKIAEKVPTGHGLVYKARSAYLDIQKADDEFCELAKLLGLDKLDVVKVETINKRS